jgi:hypothetical protein
MTHQEQKVIACHEAFADFHLDLAGCRKPEFVKQVLGHAREGLRSAEIAELLGVTPKAVQKVYRRYNFPVLKNLVPLKMEDNPAWTGGMTIDRAGYRNVRMPSHPYNNCGYVREHRLVVEAHLGRYLEPTEVVHHIDGNPANNDITNLEVFASNAEHLRETLTGKPHRISEDGRLRIAEAVRASNHRRAGLPKASSRKASENDVPKLFEY